MGRLIAIGDIHGRAGALKALLDEVSPTPDDTLVFLGDYINRGEDTKGVIDQLVALSKKTNCHFIMGNHEDILIKAMKKQGDNNLVSALMKRGGRETMTSYGAKNMTQFRKKMPKAHKRFFKDLKKSIKIGNVIFVHASYDASKPQHKQKTKTLCYEFLDVSRKPMGESRIICGHSSQKSGKPLQHGNITCIDTRITSGGWLTAYDMSHEIYYQANKEGVCRQLSATDVVQTKAEPSISSFSFGKNNAKGAPVKV